MQSLKSKLIIFLVRNRHLFKGKLKREVVDETYDVKGFRDDITKSSLKMEKIPQDITVEKVDIDGMYGEWIIPQSQSSSDVILYIHGGGFISGDCDSHRMHMVQFAKKTGLKILQFNYRIAPEHTAPCAVDDCLKAYRWLISKGYSEENIVIGGESAGGTLTLALLFAIKKSGLKYPKKAFSISPITDLRANAKSFTDNAKKDIATLYSWNVWTQMYVADGDITDPLISPQFGDPTGFPPLLICVGSYEVHLDDCVAFSKKAIESGVEVDFKIWNHMVHAFPIMAPLFKEATDAHNWICDFITN